MAHPTEKTIQAVSFTYDAAEWKILDDSIKADLDYLKTVADGEIQITSRTLDDKLLDRRLSDATTARCSSTSTTASQSRRPTSSSPATASSQKLPLVKMHPRDHQVARRAEPGQLPVAAQGTRSRRRRPARTSRCRWC